MSCFLRQSSQRCRQQGGYLVHVQHGGRKFVLPGREVVETSDKSPFGLGFKRLEDACWEEVSENHLAQNKVGCDTVKVSERMYQRIMSRLAAMCREACRECLLEGQKDRDENTNGFRCHAQAENLALVSQERGEAHHGTLNKSWVSTVLFANSFTQLFYVTAVFPA